MKKTFPKNYSLQQFNEDLLETLKDDGVNHIQMVAANDQSKISIILKSSDSQNYHGLHPTYSTEKMLNFIEKLGVASASDFWNQVSDLQNKEFKYFHLEPADRIDALDEHSKVEEILLGRSILQMASHFGYRFMCSNLEEQAQIMDELETIWNEYIIDNTNNKLSYCLAKSGEHEEELYIDFLGIWPKEVLEIVNSKFYLNNLKESDNFTISQTATATSTKIIDLYESNDEVKKYFKLRQGEVYYSGVMPRVLEIKHDFTPSTSSEIKYLTLLVGRTTFATVDCFDNPTIINHPFFRESDYYGKMIDFDSKEDIAQATHLYKNKISNDLSQRDYEIRQIEAINKYLKDSYNTHTVAVSANIETKENLLLVAKRSNSSIDSGEYYCSVNGQSEFNDDQVGFYQDSVYEDLPTMNYNSKTRIDLNHEIQREAIAEIGVSTFLRDWKYYGISFLSINNVERVRSDGSDLSTVAQVTKRRMHFNVLMFNQASFDFETIIENHDNVTEKFENSQIEGIKVRVFKKTFDFIEEYVSSFIHFIYEYSGMFSLFIVLIPTLIGAIKNIFIVIKEVFVPNNSTTKLLLDEISIGLSGTDIFELAVTALYLLFIFIQYTKKKKIRSKKTSSNIRIDKIDKQKQTENRLNLLFQNVNKDMKKHAILKLMISLYVFQKAVEEDC